MIIISFWRSEARGNFHQNQKVGLLVELVLHRSIHQEVPVTVGVQKAI